MKYPRIVKQELVNGQLVELLDEGKTFGVPQYFVYVEEGNGKRYQFEASANTQIEASNLFTKAVEAISRAEKGN